MNIFKEKVVQDAFCLRHTCWQRQCERLDNADKSDAGAYQQLVEHIGSTCGECQDRIAIQAVIAYDPKLTPSFPPDRTLYLLWIKKSYDFNSDDRYALHQESKGNKELDLKTPIGIVTKHIKETAEWARKEAVDAKEASRLKAEAEKLQISTKEGRDDWVLEKYLMGMSYRDIEKELKKIDVKRSVSKSAIPDCIQRAWYRRTPKPLPDVKKRKKQE